MSATLYLAFFTGIVSFFNPCVLPLIPGYLAYISGTTIKQLHKQKMATFINSIFFVLGFALVFSLVGVLLQTVLAQSGEVVLTWLSRIGGTVIILFGLHLTGLLEVPLLQKSYTIKTMQRKTFRMSFLTSFVFGATFAISWTPCVGALLGSVLALSISNPGNAFLLLLFYTLGMGLPFLVISACTAYSIKTIKKIQPYTPFIAKATGYILIVVGILVFTNTLVVLANVPFLNEVLLS